MKVHCHHVEGPQKNSCSHSHTVFTLPTHTKDLNKSASSEEPAFVVTSCRSWVIRVAISAAWWQKVMTAGLPLPCLYTMSSFVFPHSRYPQPFYFVRLMYCTLPGQFCNLAYGPSRIVAGVKEEEEGRNDLTESGTEDFFNMLQVLIFFSHVGSTVLFKWTNNDSLLGRMK